MEDYAQLNTDRETQVKEITSRLELNEDTATVRCWYCQIGLVGNRSCVAEKAFDEGYRVIGSYKGIFQPVVSCGCHKRKVADVKP